ncbi:hypothetical protein CYMTET_34397 [Cymbomonas tetramitiformis]|uniref:Uncharacterized protein n=1 Tax=Cymbomonas tetramitiformis TaxID=36881 RepID=A0AAE0FB79_9CHLO|nr:hypothetical protein CYMTET_34397 [Cymbomonas tetramitiformis]
MVNSSIFELPTVMGCAKLSPQGQMKDGEQPDYELVDFEDLPDVAQTLVVILREKYAEYELGVPVTRQDRICCALHPTFPWQDEAVKIQAFKDLAEEVGKAEEFLKTGR